MWRLLPVIACLAGLATARQARAQEPCAEEFAVYSVVLDSLYRNVAKTSFLVADSTRGDLRFGHRDLVEAVLASRPDVPRSLIDSYLDHNDRPCALGSRFRTRRAPVVLVGREDRERLGRESAGWDGYPDGYPAHGLITLSAVGFTPDSRQAVVHALFHCGGRCGSGQVVLLERNGDGWIVRGAVTTIQF